MDEHRNRSEGWKYAKVTGHKNEDLVCALINSNSEVQNKILSCAHKEDRKIIIAETGGSHEKDVMSVFGDKTKSKTDIYVYLDDGNHIKISVKKDLSGQVYLININRFIEGFEKQYNTEIPDEIKRGIKLFWGSADDVLAIINEFSTKNKQYELRKHRVVHDTLRKYNENLSEDLISWFSENISNLFDFCFSKGLSKNESDWADLLWYKNLVGDNELDTLINIADVKNIFDNSAEYGNRTGGSTIQLPFGFVQWHSPSKKIPGDMQFHHNYEKIVENIIEYCDYHHIEYDKKILNYKKK